MGKGGESSTSEAKHMSVRYKAGKQRSKNMANFTASEWRWDQERQTVKERERGGGEKEGEKEGGTGRQGAVATRL